LQTVGKLLLKGVRLDALRAGVEEPLPGWGFSGIPPKPYIHDFNQQEWRRSAIRSVMWGAVNPFQGLF
jgi:hypothetical protein